MSETADRRRRTDLDFFILALIDEGVSTPYKLQKFAGLSQGATIPTLQRLMEAGQVNQGPPGARGRVEYRLTTHGRDALKDGWQALIDIGPTGDLDSDLRVALLALRAGRRQVAVNFLLESAQEKQNGTDVVGPADDPAEVPMLARSYRELRAAVSKTQLIAESKAIRKLAENLPRRLAPDGRPITRPPKRRRSS